MAGHGHDNHSSHGHDEGDEIVLHQENLVPTFLVAFLFAIVALLGLAQAGNNKFVASFGTEAYQKVQSQMPKLEAKKEDHKGEEAKKLEITKPNATYETQNGSVISAPAQENKEQPKEEKKEEPKN